MLRYMTDRARPGLVALYDIQSGNGVGQLLQPRSPHGAVIGKIFNLFATKCFMYCLSNVVNYSSRSNCESCTLCNVHFVILFKKSTTTKKLPLRHRNFLNIGRNSYAGFFRSVEGRLVTCFQQNLQICNTKLQPNY